MVDRRPFETTGPVVFVKLAIAQLENPSTKSLKHTAKARTSKKKYISHHKIQTCIVVYKVKYFVVHSQGVPKSAKNINSFVYKITHKFRLEQAS